MIKKYIAAFVTCMLSLCLSVAPVFAHVVVKPDTVGVAAFQTFTIGVPNEKDNPTIAVKLIIPEGLKSVSPNVKPGWKIDVKKASEGEDATVSEITWTGGAIPEGQRDEFLFSAQVPSSETTLTWKAYQTYQDGTIVSWDQAVSDHEHEDEEKGPASTTKIVNDLKSQTMGDEDETEGSKKVLLMSGLALFLSIAAISLQLVKKK